MADDLVIGTRIEFTTNIDKINKDIEKICSELKILESRILNPNFVSRAPQQLVEKEKSQEK